jgi:hypothetical protein
MAIVYRHRRNDTNEIFYVGMGKENKRAFSKRDRNIYWKRVVDKVGYSVEIISTDLSLEDACDIECLLISEYGRKDLALGLLVNMTNGGEGGSSYVHTDEYKLKRKGIRNSIGSEFKKGSTVGVETRFKKGHISVSAGTAKKNNCKVCGITYEINKGGKIYCSNKCQGMCQDYRNKQSELKKGLYIGREFPTLKKSVLQFDKDNNFIKEFPGVREAMDITGALQISKVCKGERKTSGGFIWKYKNKQINTIIL